MKTTNYKIVKMLSVLVMLCVLGLTTESVMAQSFNSQSFLSGTNLLVNGGSTNLYSATNIYQGKGQTYGPGYTTTNTTTTYTNATAFKDVVLWADRDGSSPSVNITASAVGLNANATNKIDLLFYAVPTGPGGAQANQAQNSWQFTLTLNGTSTVTLSTNLLMTPFQGSGAIRCYSVVSQGFVSGTNGYLKSLTLNGFKP